MLGQVCLRSGLEIIGRVHLWLGGSPLSAYHRHRHHLRQITAFAGTAAPLTTFRQSALSRSRTSGTRRLQGGFVVRQKTSRLCFGECAHARSRALQGSDLSTHSRGSIRARGCPRCQSGVEIDVRTLPVNLFSFPYYLIVAQSDIGRIKIV